MHETLPIISAARRLEARKTKRRQSRPAAGSVTPIGAGRTPTLDEFELDLHSARESIFALADTARACIPHELTQLHVSLQVIANELGQVEQMLASAGEAPPDVAVRAS